MRIDEHSSVAVIVKRSWANLHGVRMFLRENGRAEIRGVDESHVLFAKVFDAEDFRGVWIELDLRNQETEVENFRILIPWSEVLAIIVAKDFSTELRHEARKIGFTGEIQPE